MVTEETNKQLFLHCKYTAQLWNLFLNILAIARPFLSIHQTFLVAGSEEGEVRVKEMVEIDSLMYMVVSMEGEKCQMFQR